MATLQDERYRVGDCTRCGHRLDDVSLAEGFERCGDCEPVDLEAEADRWAVCGDPPAVYVAARYGLSGAA